MTAYAAASLYTGLLILFAIVLQVRVIRIRRSKLIGVGHGNDRELEKAVRVHGNFVENAGFAISALILLAATSASIYIIHAVGLLMLIGRISHAIGLTSTAGTSSGRVGGMVMTFSALVIAAVALIVGALV
jgi:uncharacterized membrane protein YecN with MAPEG domain